MTTTVGRLCGRSSETNSVCISPPTKREPVEGEQQEVQADSRLLVVEDVPLLAEMLCSLLLDAGFTPVGPAGTVEAALQLMEATAVDAAILDIRLFDELSFPVAYALRERHIPFLFLTAHQKHDLPLDLRSSPLFEKPFDWPALHEGVRALLSPAEAVS